MELRFSQRRTIRMRIGPGTISGKNCSVAHTAIATTVMNANLVVNLGDALENSPDKLKDETKRRIRSGLEVTGADYIRALGRAEAQGQALDRLFDHYDAILAPAAPGQAPKGLETTGRAIFNGMWTLMGVPAVSVPLLTGADGLPIGVQVIGRRGTDAKVLQAAEWLWQRHRDNEG